MKDSIFKSTLRSFFVTIAVFLGLSGGIFILALLILLSSSEENTTKLKIDTKYKPLILPNALGIRKEESKTSPVILQLNISGIIGADSLNTNTFTQQLIESREGDLKDDRVKAILLYINSPGGTVYDADAIYRALKAYKEQYKVPIYAFVDGMCASGGVYVACAADKIFATDSSLVGSVGVLISPFLNFSKIMEKIGINSLTLTAGKNKDALNPLRPWKEGEQDNLQSAVNEYYNNFVTIVTTNRPKMDRKKLIDEYGADVFLAPQAEKYGYVDQIGVSQRDVLLAMLHELQITDQNYQVVTLEKKNWLIDLFSEQGPTNSLGQMKHSIDWGDGLPNEVRGKLLYLYRNDK